jgi:hypothetical protein
VVLVNSKAPATAKSSKDGSKKADFSRCLVLKKLTVVFMVRGEDLGSLT